MNKPQKPSSTLLAPPLLTSSPALSSQQRPPFRPPTLPSPPRPSSSHPPPSSSRPLSSQRVPPSSNSQPQPPLKTSSSTIPNTRNPTASQSGGAGTPSKNVNKCPVNYSIAFPHSFSSMEASAYRDIFIFFDRKGKGVIPYQDLGTVLRALGFLVSNSKLKEIIGELRAANKKKGVESVEEGVGFKDFFGIIGKVKGIKAEKLEVLMGPFDKEKTGWVKVEEFKQVLSTLGDILGPNEIDFVMSGLSISKNGKFEIKELINILSMIDYS
jgi:Ca2+-binding EF-hand superfamily protein